MAAKIRIFNLAKELGLDNDTLIAYCRDAGIQVKKSALASITVEQRAEVEDFIKANPSGPGDGEVKEKAAGTSEREQRGRHDKAKIRELPAGRKTASDAAETDEPVEETVAPPEPVAEVEPEPQLAEPEAEPVVEETAEPEPVAEPAPEPVAEESEAVEEDKPEPDAEESESAGEPPQAEEKEPPKEPDPEPPAQPAAPTRSDPAGRKDRPMRQVPVMTARGNVREQPRAGSGSSSGGGGRRSDRGQTNQPPMVAAVPDFQLPKTKAKKEEPKAPQPQIRISGKDMNRPLSELLKQHKQDPGTGKSRGRTGRTGGGTGHDDDDQNKRRGQGQRDRGNRRGGRGRFDDDDRYRGRKQKRDRGPIELKTEATIEPPITVRTLSEAVGRPVKKIQEELFKMGKMANINDALDEEIAELVCVELGVELTIKREAGVEEHLAAILEFEDEAETLQPRPPIVTILGHVDHGKTSLLDKIRETNVAGGEAGGITQHIRSYQVEHEGNRITFVDTPGHAAFGEMRSRGANMTDIVILVVAANDGVMPQTKECISHARAAETPVLVALNKSDLPDINEQKILTELSQNDVQPTEWGGNVEVIRTSAMSGDGIPDLLETISLQAEVEELRANPDRPALGVCIEAFQDEGKGVVAWMINQKGTLRVGDPILCGPAFGKVRALYNDRGEQIQEAPPSLPIKVSGLDIVPEPGDHYFVLNDIEECRIVAEDRRTKDRAEFLARKSRGPRDLNTLLAAAREGEVRELPLIIKADTPGSLEALRGELGKFEHDEVRITIVHEAVGGVNESDVYLAATTGAIIIAFHVIAEDRAEQLAQEEGVDIRRYSIIYEVTDKIRSELEGLLEPERREVPTGRAIVLRTFSISRVGTVAGCRVLNGTIERNNRVHVIRDQRVLNDYDIASLRREKEDVREVRDGMECGIRLAGFNDVKEGDLLEAFRVEQVARKLD